MLHVRSTDGTSIAYEKTGQGPPLIIIGGALGDHRFYLPLAGELAKHFTVYTYDRRGRGQSGDTQPYSVERELDDVAALIAEADQPALVYGHSAGSALALRATAAALNIAKLVLADPPYGRHSDADDAARARQAETAAKLQAFHDKGDHRGAAALFLSGFGLPSEAADELLGSPAGEAMIDSARALPYDYAVVGDGLLPDELAAQAAVSTLVLAAETALKTARALVEIMPRATLQRMRASTHDLPPEEIASAVTPFFRQEG
ncbi:MAG: alpha/beta fold hydrolase [Xanthobacteraceae bacterium]